MNDWARRCAIYGNEGAYLDRLGSHYRGQVPMTADGYAGHWMRLWHADPNNFWRYVRDHVVWC